MAPAADTPPVDAYIPTNRPNLHQDAKGNRDEQGVLHLQFASVQIEDIPELMQQTNSVLPDFDANHPPIVPFYIAKQRSQEQRDAMVKAAQEKLEAAFPGIHPQIVVHLMDDGQDDVKKAVDLLNKQLDEAAAQMPQDAITTEGLRLVHQAAHDAWLETDAAMQAKEPTRDSWSERLFRKAAVMRGLITIGTRGTQVATTGENVVAGLSLIGFDAAWEYFHSRYERQLAKLFMGAPLSPKTGNHPFLNRMREYWPTARATVLNTAIAGLAHPGTANLLAHATSPGLVPLFHGAAKWLSLGGISIAYGTFYFSGWRGTESLRQMGWISGGLADFILRAPGFVAMMAGMALNAPSPVLRALAPVLFGAVWMVWGVTYVVSKLLPPRTNKLVLMDSVLGRYRARVEWREGVEHSEIASVNKEELREELRKIEQIPSLDQEREKRRAARAAAAASGGCTGKFRALAG